MHGVMSKYILLAVYLDDLGGKFVKRALVMIYTSLLFFLTGFYNCLMPC